MKHPVLKFGIIILFVVAILFPVVSSATYAEELNNEISAEEKGMDCCKRMDMMDEKMKPMMESHKKMMKTLKSLIDELQQEGKLTHGQLMKINNIEQMMSQMEEKMKQMSSMENDLK